MTTDESAYQSLKEPASRDVIAVFARDVIEYATEALRAVKLIIESVAQKVAATWTRISNGSARTAIARKPAWKRPAAVERLDREASGRGRAAIPAFSQVRALGGMGSSPKRLRPALRPTPSTTWRRLPA